MAEPADANHTIEEMVIDHLDRLLRLARENVRLTNGHDARRTAQCTDCSRCP
jgi:hypothetical protein